jgi:lipopolysaccharide/colanic/teichoic acid biosynthesis glycosyltransferase
MLASSPVFLAAAPAIKITSPGSVLFIQDRVGLNKRRFPLYKFRTMVPDAEKRQAELEGLNECKGAAFKIKNVPRITRIGKILRKTSIDELPQLINVLKGEMSLVGPRALRAVAILHPVQGSGRELLCLQFPNPSIPEFLNP